MATPPINAVGSYKVLSPFTVEEGVVYKCEAINGFEALEQQGIDVFSHYYTPYGISEEKYLEDKQAGINICWLMSSEANPVIIPSSYISEYPNVASVPYSNHFLAFQLGPLPTGYVLDILIADLKDRIRAETGVEAEGELVTMPVTNEISTEEHEQMESVRQQMKLVTPSSAQKLLASEARVAELQRHIQLLEEEVTRLNEL